MSEEKTNWPKWLAIGGGVVAAAAGLGYVISLWSKYNAEKKRGGGKRRKQKPAPQQEQKAPEKAEIDEGQLLDDLNNSLGYLQTNAAVRDEDRQLATQICSMDPNALSSKGRLHAAQWLTLYHTILHMQAQTPEEYVSATQKQKADMKVAWTLLDFAPSDEEEQAPVDLIRLEVAQRLKDVSKLAPVFDRVYAKGAAMSYEEVVLLFTTAPLLGRWKSTRELGDRIVKESGEQGELKVFHQAALQRPDIPDYEVLYNLAKDEMAHGDADPKELNFKHYLIESLSIRLKDVQCDDEQKKAQVRRNFDPTGNGEWQSMPLSSDRLLRFGAIAQVLSLSAIPLPMAGPASKDRMHVMGYADMRTGDAQIRQQESYKLKRNDKDATEWEGEYTLMQQRTSEGRTGPDVPKVEIIFQMKMRLKEQDE